jgi:hypothetical protein
MTKGVTEGVTEGGQGVGLTSGEVASLLWSVARLGLSVYEPRVEEGGGEGGTEAGTGEGGGVNEYANARAREITNVDNDGGNKRAHETQVAQVNAPDSVPDSAPYNAPENAPDALQGFDPSMPMQVGLLTLLEHRVAVMTPYELAWSLWALGRIFAPAYTHTHTHAHTSIASGNPQPAAHQALPVRTTVTTQLTSAIPTSALPSTAPTSLTPTLAHLLPLLSSSSPLGRQLLAALERHTLSHALAPRELGVALWALGRLRDFFPVMSDDFPPSLRLALLCGLESAAQTTFTSDK